MSKFNKFQSRQMQKIKGEIIERRSGGVVFRPQRQYGESLLEYYTRIANTEPVSFVTRLERLAAKEAKRLEREASRAAQVDLEKLPNYGVF